MERRRRCFWRIRRCRGTVKQSSCSTANGGRRPIAEMPSERRRCGRLAWQCMVVWCAFVATTVSPIARVSARTIRCECMLAMLLLTSDAMVAVNVLLTSVAMLLTTTTLPTHAQRVHAFRNREQLRSHHAQRRQARMNLVSWSPRHTSTYSCSRIPLHAYMYPDRPTWLAPLYLSITVPAVTVTL